MISPMIQRSQSIASLGAVVSEAVVAAVITAAAITTAITIVGKIAEAMNANVVWRVGSPLVPSCA